MTGNIVQKRSAVRALQGGSDGSINRADNLLDRDGFYLDIPRGKSGGKERAEKNERKHLYFHFDVSLTGNVVFVTYAACYLTV